MMCEPRCFLCGSCLTIDMMSQFSISILFDWNQGDAKLLNFLAGLFIRAVLSSRWYNQFFTPAPALQLYSHLQSFRTSWYFRVDFSPAFWPCLIINYVHFGSYLLTQCQECFPVLKSDTLYILSFSHHFYSIKTFGHTLTFYTNIWNNFPHACFPNWKR